MLTLFATFWFSARKPPWRKPLKTSNLSNLGGNTELKPSTCWQLCSVAILNLPNPRLSCRDLYLRLFRSSLLNTIKIQFKMMQKCCKTVFTALNTEETTLNSEDSAFS